MFARMAAINLFQVDLDESWYYLLYCYVRATVPRRFPPPFKWRGSGAPIMHPLSGVPAFLMLDQTTYKTSLASLQQYHLPRMKTSLGQFFLKQCFPTFLLQRNLLQMFANLCSSNPSVYPTFQARAQHGTPGGTKSFLREVQFFELCPIVLNYVQHIFSGGAKVF